MEEKPDAEVKKRPMTDRERKASQREREKAIASGTYVKSPFEQAKELLSAQAYPEMMAIETNQELSSLLTADNKKQLHNFISNLK